MLDIYMSFMNYLCIYFACISIAQIDLFLTDLLS